MQIKIDEEDFSRVVAEDLLWSYEHAHDKKLRKALRRAAVYYMTYPQCVEYFGREKTEELWCD